MPHQCPTNDEGITKYQCPMTKSAQRSIRHWPLVIRDSFVIGGAFDRIRHFGPAAIVLLAFVTAALRAQVPGTVPTYYTNQPAIVIPFSPDGMARVKQVNLFYSVDQGQDWKWSGSAQPGD